MFPHIGSRVKEFPLFKVMFQKLTWSERVLWKQMSHIRNAQSARSNRHVFCSAIFPTAIMCWGLMFWLIFQYGNHADVTGTRDVASFPTLGADSTHGTSRPQMLVRHCGKTDSHLSTKDSTPSHVLGLQLGYFVDAMSIVEASFWQVAAQISSCQPACRSPGLTSHFSCSTF